MTATALPPTSPETNNARLVRNLLAMRMILSVGQMQSGKWGEHIEDIDENLAALGHDMKSTTACAADSVRRTFLLPRMVSRSGRARHQPSRQATPRE